MRAERTGVLEVVKGTMADEKRGYETAHFGVVSPVEIWVVFVGLKEREMFWVLACVASWAGDTCASVQLLVLDTDTLLKGRHTQMLDKIIKLLNEIEIVLILGMNVGFELMFRLGHNPKQNMAFGSLVWPTQKS